MQRGSDRGFDWAGLPVIATVVQPPRAVQKLIWHAGCSHRLSRGTPSLRAYPWVERRRAWRRPSNEEWIGRACR
jgi:hypothetical protein